MSIVKFVSKWRVICSLWCIVLSMSCILSVCHLLSCPHSSDSVWRAKNPYMQTYTHSFYLQQLVWQSCFLYIFLFTLHAGDRIREAWVCRFFWAVSFMFILWLLTETEEKWPNKSSVEKKHAIRSEMLTHNQMFEEAIPLFFQGLCICGVN